MTQNKIPRRKHKKKIIINKRKSWKWQQLKNQNSKVCVQAKKKIKIIYIYIKKKKNSKVLWKGTKAEAVVFCNMKNAIHQENLSWKTIMNDMII